MSSTDTRSYERNSQNIPLDSITPSDLNTQGTSRISVHETSALESRESPANGATDTMPDQITRRLASLSTTNDAQHVDQETQDGEGTASERSGSGITPKKNLGFVQITSLILNSVIGSGIFTTPGYVLALTRSKPISLVLWAVGGVYTALWYEAD